MSGSNTVMKHGGCHDAQRASVHRKARVVDVSQSVMYSQPCDDVSASPLARICSSNNNNKSSAVADMAAQRCVCVLLSRVCYGSRVQVMIIAAVLGPMCDV